MRGWSELLLLGAVCTACWFRTPVGGLAHNAVAWLRDEEGRDLLSHFDTRLPTRMEETLRQALVVAEPDPQDLPEGWSPALHLAVQAHLGEDAAKAIAAMGMDQPEDALEIWAIGAEQRGRAIRRAAAAGEPHPELFAAHRRFLPAEAAAKADEAVGEVLALSTALDLSWPVDPSWRVSSPFGWREHPTLKSRRFHEGVDLATPVGTRVQAAGDGSVERARADGVNGKYVKLAHGHGVTTAYCHGDAFHVSKGQRVRRGEVVMQSGNTGRSSGPHLHFGLRIDGHAVDPALLRSASGDWTAPSTPLRPVVAPQQPVQPEPAAAEAPEPAPDGAAASETGPATDPTPAEPIEAPQPTAGPATAEPIEAPEPAAEPTAPGFTEPPRAEPPPLAVPEISS